MVELMISNPTTDLMLNASSTRNLKSLLDCEIFIYQANSPLYERLQRHMR